MTEYRLKPEVQAFLLELCEPGHRRHLDIHLDFGSASMRDSFETALENRMDVHADVLDSEPNEICVQATGEADGAGWRNMNIILLAPEWATDAASSQHAADLIVEHWPRLCEIHAAAPVRQAA